MTAAHVPAPSAHALAERYLYWTGCAANYDPRIATIVRATTRILRAAGIDVIFLGEEEVCTGDAARRLGLTLVGFVRDGRFNVYAGAARVALARA